MAASQLDFFTKVGNPGSATTLAAPGHAIAGTSITVVSTTNWPTTTGVIFAMDTYTNVTVNGVVTEVRNVGSYTEWEAVVASSTSITNMVLRYGTDQVYPAGATTRVYIPVASSRENRFVDGMLVSHAEDGTILATSPKILTSINDTNGNELISLTSTGSAVNQLTVTNSATGNAPSLTTTGGDTNAGLSIGSKGTGNVTINGNRPWTYLASASAVADQGSITTVVDLTSLALTVTVPAGATTVRITGFGRSGNSAANAINSIYIFESTTQLSADQFESQSGGANVTHHPLYIGTATAGSHTYKLRADAGTGTMILKASSTAPAYIVVECC